MTKTAIRPDAWADEVPRHRMHDRVSACVSLLHGQGFMTDGEFHAVMGRVIEWAAPARSDALQPRKKGI